MARLWKMFGNTPFMINPHLGILGAMNPRKKGSSTMTAAQRRMAYVRSFQKKRNPRRRRHHAKRNPFPVGGLIVNHRRKHRRKHNPGVFAGLMGRARSRANSLFTMPPLQTVLWTGAGLIGTPYVESYLAPYIPVSISSTTLGKYAVRVGVVLGLGFVAKKTVGAGPANAIMIGGGAYVLTSALKEFMPGTFAGLGAYTPNTSLRAYTPNLKAATWGAQNGINAAGGGGRNIVAGRFRRFQ